MIYGDLSSCGDIVITYTNTTTANHHKKTYVFHGTLVLWRTPADRAGLLWPRSRSRCRSWWCWGKLRGCSQTVGLIPRCRDVCSRTGACWSRKVRRSAAALWESLSPLWAQLEWASVPGTVASTRVARKRLTSLRTSIFGLGRARWASPDTTAHVVLQQKEATGCGG